MRASKRWYDNGSKRVPLIECFPVSMGASITQSAYIVTVNIQRESLNDKRKSLHETERMQLTVTLPEAREMVKLLQQQIYMLEYYSTNAPTNAQWPKL